MSGQALSRGCSPWKVGNASAATDLRRAPGVPAQAWPQVAQRGGGAQTDSGEGGHVLARREAQEQHFLGLEGKAGREEGTGATRNGRGNSRPISF